MKQPSELTRAQLEAVVLRIRDILRRDPVTGELDPEKFGPWRRSNASPR
jgi:hypothetical protein